LDKEDLIALILAQADIIARLTEQTALLEKRVADLEEKVGKPPKTPDNSSIPRGQGYKPSRQERRAAAWKGRPGVARALVESPGEIVEARAEARPYRAHGPGPQNQEAFHAYDHIDLPPIRPVVTRIHRHRGACPCCARTKQAGQGRQEIATISSFSSSAAMSHTQTTAPKSPANPLSSSGNSPAAFDHIGEQDSAPPPSPSWPPADYADSQPFRPSPTSPVQP
jgi:hypothetical protein